MGFANPGIRGSNPKAGDSNPESRIPNPEFANPWDWGSRIPLWDSNPESRNWDWDSRIEIGIGIRESRFGIRIPNPESRIPKLGLGFANPALGFESRIPKLGLGFANPVLGFESRIPPGGAISGSPLLQGTKQALADCYSCPGPTTGGSLRLRSVAAARHRLRHKRLSARCCRSCLSQALSAGSLVVVAMCHLTSNNPKPVGWGNTPLRHCNMRAASNVMQGAQHVGDCPK